MTIWTIGHSTHPIDEFIVILKAYQIELLADIRTIPKSRHNPQFGIDQLPKSLQTAGIQYRHLAGLGGLRPAKTDSPNTGWRNKSFQGYADYMQTSEFEQALGELIQLAKINRIAIMCAEAVPWRCHRSLVGDALTVRDVEVLDILSANDAKPHQLTSFAVTNGTNLTYPAGKI